MTLRASIELVALEIDLLPGPNGGASAPGEPGPQRNLLDLTLHIDPELVLVDDDAMDRVFDYDPIVADIARIATAQLYETHERMIALMAEAVAARPAVAAAELFVRKRLSPERGGHVGVRLRLESEDLARLREAAA